MRRPTSVAVFRAGLFRSAFASLLAIAFFAFGASAPSPVQAEDAIGVVKSAKGNARVSRKGRGIPLAVGDPVFRQDTLITGPDSSLGVTFRDRSRMSLGPDSRLSLTSFEFEPTENKLSFVSRMAHGTLHFITGVIAKLSSDAVSVETPVATIAVRGTNFAIRVPKPS